VLNGLFRAERGVEATTLSHLIMFTVHRLVRCEGHVA
jgi:hypothetical protein